MVYSLIVPSHAVMPDYRFQHPAPECSGYLLQKGWGLKILLGGWEDRSRIVEQCIPVVPAIILHVREWVILGNIHDPGCLPGEVFELDRPFVSIESIIDGWC